MRSRIEPILQRIPAARQKDARHYGVHPYFTRRPPNVVREYVRRYSEPGDTVLDPFGGTGVTAIEAFLLGRHAIHNDLNPFANFLAGCLVDVRLPSLGPLLDAFGRVEDACRDLVLRIEGSEAVASKQLNTLPLPENVPLPRTSDAERFHDLFTPRQLAGLASIKQAVDAETDSAVRGPLLLAWSAAVAKLNRTFLSANGRAASRGGSSIFSIYRYKLAKKVVELPIWETFEGRFRNVLAAKREVLACREADEFRSAGVEPTFRVLQHDAAALDEVLAPESIDYVFTDPPYGGFIGYLDLSTMWNHWLGFPVSAEALDCETVVGGERRHTEEHYRESLARSVRTCLRLLKPDRWFSIVFQHWDVAYFETILDTATESGAELVAAITQTGDVVWSMHRKKNSASVLGGELILTFRKPSRSRRPKRSGRAAVEVDERLLERVLDAALSVDLREFTHEALFNNVVIELWRKGALACLGFDRDVFRRMLEERGWAYRPDRHVWTCAEKPSGTKRVATLF